MKVRINEVRVAKGVPQEVLADQLGISRSYLSQLESGARKLTTERQLEIARALDVDPTELVDFAAPSKGEEDLILHAFRQLSPEQRRAWLDMARIVLGRREPDE